MLTNREKRLLYLLAVVIVIVATGLFFYFRYTDLLLVERQITSITKQIQKILTNTPDEESLAASIADMTEAINIERNRFYKSDEIDLSTFSVVARKLIEENNLIVNRVTRESKPKVRYIEFQLEGSAYNLARFLSAVSSYKKYWSVRELNVDNKSKDGKHMNITIRMIYEVYSTDNN